MIVLLSLQVFDDCEQNYPRILQHNDSLQSSTATEKGTAQYLLCGIRGSLSQVFDIQIPNITVPINIGVTQIDFSLTDIKIFNLQVPELDVKLNEQNIVQLYLPNCDVDLKFQWKFQQSSYPYTTDSGSGTVVLRNGTMSGSAISEVDGVKCPGHMKVNVIKSNLEYQSLKIQLQGGQSWIFQSLIDIIMEAVQVQIAGFISSTMSAGFVKLANDVFEDGRREMNYTNNKFIKDERYTDRVQIGSRFATLLFSGQTYLKENLTDEYITEFGWFGEIGRQQQLLLYNYINRFLTNMVQRLVTSGICFKGYRFNSCFVHFSQIKIIIIYLLTTHTYLIDQVYQHLNFELNQLNNSK
ncbi:Conserved_hypothetical protein [Hexamita inflata]|uniref:Lipid-binding serum glycoprotein N-terminal domain-containing protein n=1 Tax=Hexamita inflata TaxID=28002 RepID=A0AA86QNI8_9EUKA|nr:Conserved hypothetical protein [Hexamita inflata]